jgi:hypothetical protein
MKTAIVMLTLALLSACAKNSNTPLPSENTNTHCYQVYDAENGKVIKGAQVEIDLDTKSGNAYNALLCTNKTGMACANLPDTEEFHLLNITAPGYLTESFSSNRQQIAMIKPCFLQLHINKNDENKAADLLIIHYKISSQNSEQILITGKTDTTITVKADPRGKSVYWIYNNNVDSVLYKAHSGETAQLSLSL